MNTGDNKYITAAEMQLAKIIWEHNGISSKELVDECEQRYNMKMTTTYTLLKRICNKKIFELVKKRINVLVTEEEYALSISKDTVDNHYNGNVPAFIAGFVKKEKLSKKQIEEIKKMIENL